MEKVCSVNRIFAKMLKTTPNVVTGAAIYISAASQL